MRNKTLYFCFTLLFCVGGITFAQNNESFDHITLVDGSRINGRIIRMSEDYLYFESALLGQMKIKLKDIQRQESSDLREVNSFQGESLVRKPDAILEKDKTPVKPISKLANSAKAEKASEGVIDFFDSYKEYIEIKSHIELKTGNTDRSTFNIRFEYGMKDDEKDFKLYSRFRKEKSNGETTENEKTIGVDYEQRYSDINSWYLRSKWERDEADLLNLRSTYAAGIAHFFYKEPKTWTLRGRAGFFARFENFIDESEDLENSGLDLGINSDWKINHSLELKNELVYTPSLTDFMNDFIIEHESTLKIWLTDDHRWSFGLGVRHLYTSPTADDREPLDSTYFSNISMKLE